MIIDVNATARRTALAHHAGQRAVVLRRALEPGGSEAFLAALAARHGTAATSSPAVALHGEVVSAQTGELLELAAVALAWADVIEEERAR